MVEDKEFIITEVPIELLFHENIYDMGKPNKHGKKTEEWILQHLKYANSSIMRLWPHIELFRHIMGIPNESPDKYLSWYLQGFQSRNRKPRYSETGILNRRIKQYSMLNKELEAKSDYFYQNPIEVMYNRKGYFNLDDGHHRAVFLYLQGKRTIYVRMPKNDYDYWVYEDAVKNLTSFIKSKRIMEIETPILNPLLKSIKVKRDWDTPMRLELIFNYLGEKDLKGVRVIDIGCEAGYFSRQFVREGASVVGIESNENSCKMIKKINKLERVDFELIKDKFEDAVLPEFDFGLRLHSFFFQKEDKSSVDKFLKQVNQSIKRLLFWEEGRDIELEKKLILDKTFFTSYEKLGVTRDGGEEKELGVFS